MTGAEISSAVGIVCYGLAAAFGIRFSETAETPTAAALAPPVLLTSGGLAESDYSIVLVACQCTAILAIFTMRRPLRSWLIQAGAFSVSASALVVLEGVIDDRLIRAIVGAGLYLIVDYALQRLRARKPLLPVEDRRTWVLLQAVLICACGLTVLGVRQVGWLAFLAMASVLVLTKREFEAFAKSRIAYAQTILAIDHLKSLESRSETL